MWLIMRSELPFYRESLMLRISHGDDEEIACRVEERAKLLRQNTSLRID